MENHFIDKDVDRHVYKDINADMDVGTIDKQNVYLPVTFFIVIPVLYLSSISIWFFYFHFFSKTIHLVLTLFQ